MANTRYIITFLLALVVTQCIWAQSTFQNFNENSGLPSNEVYCAFEDREGYMWFGTDHGIARYNGYQFTIYTTLDGLTDNTVFLMQQDKSGRLWFFTLNGGICYYDKGKFHPHPMNDSIVSIFRKQIPTSWNVAEDFTVWLGNVDNAFFKVTKNNMYRFGSIPKFTSSPPYYLYTVNLKTGGYVYSMFSEKNAPTISDSEILSIKKYKLDWNYLQFSTNNFQLIQISDEKSLLGIGQKLIIVSESGISYEYTFEEDNKLVKLKQLQNGEIWISSVNSIAYRLSIKHNKFTFTDSLLFSSVSDITKIKNGVYWASTTQKGIYSVPNIKIKEYKYKEIIINNKITLLKTYASKLYVPYKGLSLLAIDSVMKPHLIKGKRESVTTTGLDFDETGRPVSNHDNLFSVDSATPYPEYYFSKVLHLNKDTFFAGGTGGFGLFKVNKMFYSSRSYGFTDRVTDVASISKDTLIIGTLSGLYYFIKNKKSYTIIENINFRNSRITGISIRKRNLYAISTRGNGLYLYIKNKLYKIEEKIGLINNLTEGVVFQDDSTLWVASYSGISKIYITSLFSSPKFTVKSYTKEDGLCSNQVNNLALHNNLVWLATNEGLCYFKPDALKSHTDSIQLYVTDVEINGNNFTDTLLLQSWQNNVTIKYNALYYNASSSVRYKIRLSGLEEWHYTNKNSIEYFTLAPGDYQFEVAAEDKYGRYTSEVKKLNFTIKPHFTQTLLFKGLIMAVILCIIAIIIYLLFAYQKFKAQNVIKLLQSEFKALNYQINPHFIFNVLNSIQYYILRKDSDKAVNFLSFFSTLIRRIVSNSRQQYISVIEEVECLKDYLDLEKLRLENKFDYELNIDSSVDIEKKMMLPMILQPLVENSIWHGIVPLEEKGLIKVDFKKDEDGALICTVDDNGVGINSTKLINKKEQNNLSLAMGNVKERLKIIGELNGSEWFINFKDKSELNNKERGTIVTIRFPIAKTE